LLAKQALLSTDEMLTLSSDLLMVSTFTTFKAHLSSASEVFNHMFSSPQPSGTTSDEELADGLPIVKALLCYCDPNISWWSSSVPLIDIQDLAMK